MIHFFTKLVSKKIVAITILNIHSPNTFKVELIKTSFPHSFPFLKGETPLTDAQVGKPLHQIHHLTYERTCFSSCTKHPKF